MSTPDLDLMPPVEDDRDLELAPPPDEEAPQAPAVREEAAAGLVQSVAPLVDVLPADFPLPALIRFVPDVRLRAAAEQAAVYALQVDVTGPEGLQRADRAMSAVRTAQKAIEHHFTEPTEIANQLHKRLTSLRGEWLAKGKETLTLVGQRYYDEDQRLKRVEDERRRKAQEEADRQAREAAAREADAAKKAKAPAAVVQQLELEAAQATAPPVPVQDPIPVTNRSTSSVTTWKTRPKGTEASAREPQATMADLSTAQRAHVLEAMQACLEGKAPLVVFEINWSYLDQRARADKSTFNIPGFETYMVGGTRAKSSRVK
jgi:hypothetical protein